MDEDLAEALALVHDFGHTPFGHTARTRSTTRWRRGVARPQCAVPAHRHPPRRRYAEFDGLNLTWETLEGLVKHNGPLVDAEGRGLKGAVPQSILDYCELHDLEIDRHAGIEAQCAAIADDIAYNTHDIDDGLRAGLLTLDMLEGLALPARSCALCASATRRWTACAPATSFAPPDHHLVEDVIATAMRRLTSRRPQSATRCAPQPTLVGFSPETAAAEAELKAFLFRNLYRHEAVMRVRAGSRPGLRRLFYAYLNDPRSMPEGWREGLDRANDRVKARHVADFLAGMTDNYAIKEYTRLFDREPDLR